MTTFIDLDSFWRDRETFPNEFDYGLTPSQVDTWFSESRTVRAYPDKNENKVLEFSTTVKILYLILPYSDDLAELPKVYINFRSRNYKDIHLIHSIDGRKADIKFICVFDKIQDDRNGNPTWIHYKCCMEQAMRFKRGDEVYLTISTRDGTVLPQSDNNIPDDPNPLKQTLMTLEISPYITDTSYSNHMQSTLVA